MLQKKYRLAKRKQFNYIYRKGRNVGCDCLTLVYCFAKMKNIKVGFSVSKKIGGSVVRHRVLRKMREAIRPLVGNGKVKTESLKLVDNHNYIFVAKESIVEKSVIEIREAMKGVLVKAELLTPSPSAQSSALSINKPGVRVWTPRKK